MLQKLRKTDDLILIHQHRTHINKFCVQLLYDIDALQPESSWQIVLKKSEEGSDADKIKHLNEKAVFTSSYFGAQNIWDLYLYKLTVDQYTEIFKALAFAWRHLILKWRELHFQTEPRLTDRKRFRPGHQCQRQLVLSCASQMPLLRKKTLNHSSLRENILFL